MMAFHVKAVMGWGIMAHPDSSRDARFSADVQP
jgi:hypothetical protein